MPTDTCMQKISSMPIVVGLMLTLVFLTSCHYSSVSQGRFTNESNTALSGEAYITYDLIKNTSMKTCANCHSGNQAPNLSGLAEIQNNLDLIHDETSSASMPPIESGYNPLDGCYQAILDQWLALGAPDETTVQLKSIEACSGP